MNGPKKIAIIVDDHIANKYSNAIKDILDESGFSVNLHNRKHLSADTFKRHLATKLAECTSSSDILVLVYYGQYCNDGLSMNRHVSLTFTDQDDEHVTSWWLDQLLSKSKATVYKLFVVCNSNDYKLVKFSYSTCNRIIEIFVSYDGIMVTKDSVETALYELYKKGQLQIEKLQANLVNYWARHNAHVDDYGVKKQLPLVYKDEWEGTLFQNDLRQRLEF